MRIGILGINYKSAPLDLREKIAQACRHLSPNKIVLSTCYRTEIYFSQDDLAEAQSELFYYLKKRAPHSQEYGFYTFFDAECFFHLACVVAGLDSAMPAESDVQRQVKLAYEQTRLQQHLAPPLHYLFQKALKLGKTVRSTFPLFQSPRHLEGMVYQLMRHILGDTTLLFIGNSDINRKMIHYFWRKGKRQMTLCTRDLASAEPFALDYQLTLKDRSEIDRWHHYEGVIAATTSEEHLIKSMPEETKTRLILDLSVPRCVDPSFNRDSQLTLLNMEQIGACFESYRSERLSEIHAVKSYLREAVEKYTALYEKKIVLSNKCFI